MPAFLNPFRIVSCMWCPYYFLQICRSFIVSYFIFMHYSLSSIRTPHANVFRRLYVYIYNPHVGLSFWVCIVVSKAMLRHSIVLYRIGCSPLLWSHFLSHEMNQNLDRNNIKSFPTHRTACVNERKRNTFPQCSEFHAICRLKITQCTKWDALSKLKNCRLFICSTWQRMFMANIDTWYK